MDPPGRPPRSHTQPVPCLSPACMPPGTGTPLLHGALLSESGAPVPGGVEEVFLLIHHLADT